ncbi:MAG: hypothetical protein NTZ33_09000, partial [Bacteroidetes bacterium]|nr:hypothetical protein [Bacteroidota bacterium]
MKIPGCKLNRIIRYLIFLFIGIINPVLSFGITKSATPPPPVNDECAAAIYITPTATNSYTTFDNFNATISTGVTAPPCATPMSGDVWFAVMVSSSGHLIFDSKAGSITDGGMAIYTGSCSNLTLIACNDDKAPLWNDTGNPAYPDKYMPQIDKIGLPMYMLVYIRFWGKGATNFGTFQLTVVYSPTQPPCTNPGFENDYSGWFATLGQQYIGAPGAPTPVYFPITFNNTSDPNFAIVTTGNDIYGGFPKVYSGTKSIRIGDTVYGQNYDAASIEQTFTVGSNTNFIYHYAVVLQNGNHPFIEQPFFQIDLFDQNGTLINCGIYSVALPNTAFIQSTVNSYTYYKPWTPISVNLSAYLGQNVTIRFTVADCAQLVHIGYAYLDCECQPFGITSTLDTICIGNTDTLSAPPGALSYVWTPGNDTTQKIVVSPATNTNYSCLVTTMGNTPCSSTVTKTIYVYPVFHINATDNSPICPGDTFKLFSDVPNLNYYSWTGPNGYSDSIQNPIRTNTVTSMAGSYIITAKNSTDCIAKDTVQLAFYPLPTIITTNGTACIHDTTTLSASGGISYLWNTGSTNSSISVAPLTTTTYHVTVTDQHGCSDSSTVIAQIFPLPVIQITGDTNICKGDSTMLTASGGVSYLWDNTDTTAYTVVKPTFFTTYKVIVKDINGCKDSLTKSVDIFPIPVPMIAVETDTICKGAYTTIT